MLSELNSAERLATIDEHNNIDSQAASSLTTVYPLFRKGNLL